MREVFQQSLEDVQDRLVEIAELVHDRDRQGDPRVQHESTSPSPKRSSRPTPIIDEKAVALDELAIEILARQQPVARDLRIVVSALRISASLERMGDIAEHIAQLARYRFPERAIPKGLQVAPSPRWASSTSRSPASSPSCCAPRTCALAEEIRNEDDKIDDAAPQRVRQGARRQLEGRGGRHRRRHARQPLPRALRRPRGLDREEGRSTSPPATGPPRRRHDRRPIRPVAQNHAKRADAAMRHPLFVVRRVGYFLPCAATAAAPAAAASGSRYSPGPSGMKSSSSS